MAVTYSVVPLRNLLNPEQPEKFYAKAQASGESGFNEIAEDIAYATSLTDGDVLNVLRALVVQIRKRIQRGEIVRLENLGSFQIQLSSKGSVKKEDFTPNLIRKVRLQFRPGTGLKMALNTTALTFRSVPTLKDVAAAETPGNGPGVMV